MSIAPTLVVAILVGRRLGELFTIMSGIEAYVSIGLKALFAMAIDPLIALTLMMIPQYVVATRLRPAKLFRQVI